MGSSQSTSDKRHLSKKYTDNEIKQNIQRLFNNNRENNFSEYSFSAKDLENIIVSDDFNKPQLGGVNVNNVKFASSKKRHLNHNIDEYIDMIQNGGHNENDNEYHELSEMSEFKNIREFLRKDMGLQGGGDYNVNSYIDSVSFTEDKKKLTLYAILQDIMHSGGAKDDDSDDIDEDDEDNDHDDVDHEDDDNEDDDDNENEDVDDDELEATLGDKDTINDSSISSVSSFVPSYSGMSPTSYSESSVNRRSTSSHSNASSELNIVPFYSSDESENMVHPYVKNRFN